MGVPLARWLASAGHEIAVVDTERHRCAAVDEALGSVSVLGDATDAGVLAKAGANRADALIATSSRDDVNLVVCQLARHKFGTARTISIVNHPDHTRLFDSLGVDVTVDVNDLALGRIQEGLSTPGLVRLMPLSMRDGMALVSVKIPTESGTKGRPLRDIPLPEGTAIALVVHRDGNVSIPSESTSIGGGDEVVAVTTTQGEEKLIDILIAGQESE